MSRSLLSRLFEIRDGTARRRLTCGTAVVAIGVICLLAVNFSRAAGLGLKPGLWDVRLVRQVVDGHDVSQQLTESMAKAHTALARLPPGQRAHTQALLERSANHTSFRIDCALNGAHIRGKGEAVSQANAITARSDITTRDTAGSMHTIRNETRMQYVSADCGSLRAPHR